MNTITNTVSQTLESFIKEHGGVVKFYKNYTLCYGLSHWNTTTALKTAKTQGYSIECVMSDPINSFRYWKEVK